MRMSVREKFRQENARKRKGEQPYFPKGFDITLVAVISEYNLSEEEIKKIGELTVTKRSGLAHATIGHQVYYRRRQLEDLFGRKPVGSGISTGRFNGTEVAAGPRSDG